jgi:hypothetical protein
VVVVSRTALACSWVRGELQVALKRHADWQSRNTHTIERLRATNLPYATFYEENRRYFEWQFVPVVLDPIPPDELQGDWSILRDAMPATPLEAPLDEADILSRAMKAVAAAVFPVEKRMMLVSFALDEYERFRREGQPTATAEDALASLPVPLASEDPIEELIQRGQALSGDEAIPPERADADSPAVWCVVANVAEEQHYGPGGSQVRHGTKHFAPGAKVYCLPAQWGDGYEAIKVIGHHRKSHRYIKIVMPSRYLTNWRADLVYSPHVIREIDNRWDGTAASRQQAEELAQMCREREIARNQPA